MLRWSTTDAWVSRSGKSVTVYDAVSGCGFVVCHSSAMIFFFFFFLRKKSENEGSPTLFAELS